MTDEEKQATGTFYTIDEKRNVIVYDPQCNHYGKWDYNINETTQNMAEIAAKEDMPVEATFNRTTFQMKPGMTAEEGVKEWDRVMTRNYEEYKKSPEYKAAQLAAAQERERKEKQKLADDELIKGETLDISSLKTHFEHMVKVNSKDEYGKGIIDYAVRWGKLMQAEMKKQGLDHLTPELVKDTDRRADIYGMSGASASFGRNLLIRTWKYGHELEKIEFDRTNDKEFFMMRHQRNLEASQKLTNGIRLGMLKTEVNPEMLKVDGEGFKIKESHTFQEVLAKSDEFADILRSVKKANKITLMKAKVAFQHDIDKVRDKLYGRPADNNKKEPERVSEWEEKCARQIVEDGNTYDTIGGYTSRAVSDEFYRRHKDDLAEVLGKENLDTLKRQEEKNEFINHIKLDKLVVDRGGHVGFVYGTCFGSGGTIGFVGELCQGHKPKAGDKILLTENFIEDAEFGKIEKRDAFVYENGKYKHFYQEYSPLRDDNTVEKIVDITKAMQQKSQSGAKRDGAER